MKILSEFEMGQSKDLLTVLEARQLLSRYDADTIVHALADIAGSIERIYFDIVPEILSERDATIEVLKERLWDLREEFRHIDYHIHDAHLTE